MPGLRQGEANFRRDVERHALEVNSSINDCILRLDNQGIINVKDYGAKGDGVTDDTAAIQAAIDAGGTIYVPSGTYMVSATLQFKVSGTVIQGGGRSTTTIASSVVPGNAVIENATKLTATLLWCRLLDIRVAGQSTLGPIVDWTSMQFGSVERCWVIGPNTSGSIGVEVRAGVYGTTEGTYNQFLDNYVGLCQYGYRLDDGANSNQIIGGRVQVGIAGAIGVLLFASVLGRVNNNMVQAVGFEYPGNTMLGVNINALVDTTLVIGNRFEAQYVGVQVDATSINATVIGNYYDGCTYDVLDAGEATLILEDGRLTLPAPTTAAAPINLRHGLAPSAPSDGDMWTTSAGLYVRINGSTVGPLS